MPFGWALVAAQLGYLAVRLDETYGRRIAILVPGIVAMVGIGYYESLAHLIGLWEYVLAPFAMVARVPIFIALGEGLMFALLIYILDRNDPVLAGIGFGVVIFISYGLAYTGLWALALLTTL